MPTSLDDTAVARGLRAGERAAWDSLYDQFSEPVWRYVARLLGGDAGAVGDVVQETFLAAAETARQFDEQRGTLGAWVFGIAHFKVAAYWRRQGRGARVRELAEANEIASAESFEELIARREAAELVRATLAELPADYAAALTAKYLDERSLEEMAELLGGTVESQKSRLARARLAFREKWEGRVEI